MVRLHIIASDAETSQSVAKRLHFIAPVLNYDSFIAHVTTLPNEVALLTEHKFN